MSGDLRSQVAPGRAMLEHGVEDDEQLAHPGCEGQLLRPTCGQQPLVEVPDYGVVAELSTHVGRVLTYERLLERVWRERGDADVRPIDPP